MGSSIIPEEESKEVDAFNVKVKQKKKRLKKSLKAKNVDSTVEKFIPENSEPFDSITPRSSRVKVR